jgi:CheY-like chemotaxis protein
MAYNNVPIVAVSASDPSEAIPKTRNKGFAGFLLKPIRNNTFAPQIQSLLQGEAIWQTR